MMWKNWVNGLLGLWVLVIPFLGIADSTLTTTLVITGIIIAVLGFWSASEGAPRTM